MENGPVFAEIGVFRKCEIFRNRSGAVACTGAENRILGRLNRIPSQENSANPPYFVGFPVFKLHPSIREGDPSPANPGWPWAIRLSGHILALTGLGQKPLVARKTALDPFRKLRIDPCRCQNRRGPSDQRTKPHPCFSNQLQTMVTEFSNVRVPRESITLCHEELEAVGAPCREHGGFRGTVFSTMVGAYMLRHL